VWFYGTIRILFRVIALPMFRFRVYRADRVPRSGPAVVVAAHRSWLDPACVAGALPRPVRFLILESVYRKVWARWFYRAMRSIPVQSGQGPLSLGALRGALRALGEGQLIGLFPEGRVFPEGPLGSLHAGAALLAIRGRAPVIPVDIRGSSRAWPHGRAWPGPAPVRVRFGEPIDPPLETGREAAERFMARIGAALAELAGEGCP